MIIDYEDLFKKAINLRVNLFLGSGFSILSFNKEGIKLPVGEEYSSDLVRDFNKKNLTSLKLPRLFSIIESENKEGLYKNVINRFTVGNYNKLYKNMLKLNIGSIFTTNVDDLIFRVVEEENKYYINDVTLNGPELVDTSAINYLPLHGCVRNPNEFVFSENDIVTTFSKDPDKWRHLSHGIQELPTIFWGYSMEDAGVIAAISSKVRNDRPAKNKWIVLYNADEASEIYFRSCGFFVINSDTKEMLKYLDENIRVEEKLKIDNIPNELFPDVVSRKKTYKSVRPINDFFLGNQPIWSDILTNKISKTEHCINTQNQIASKHHVLITGIPGSGKTTIAMQTALECASTNLVLFYNMISKNKAIIIHSILGGQNAIVFIDDASSSKEAVFELLSHDNIQIVLIERDTNLSVFPQDILNKFKKINSTEISIRDYQKILLTIPKELLSQQRKSYNEEYITENNLSVFDIIAENIELATIQERVTNLLSYLSVNDPEALNLLIMIAYVSSCNTLSSLDMIISFLNLDDFDYSEINKRVRRLGEIICDYTQISAFIDLDQDFYFIRSKMLCDSIMNTVEPFCLRNVVQEFHDHVFPFKISNYDVFQRKAYDSTLISKIFHNYADGKRFYMEIYNRDQNYYLKQQGALYLLGKNQYQEAFDWIDQALVESSGKVFSIRNSHAVILFLSSINDYTNNELAAKNLKSSLEILKNCYEKDNRKDYHAEKFADFSIKYYERFHSEVGFSNLFLAKKWLKEIMKNYENYPPRRITQLYKKLNRYELPE